MNLHHPIRHSRTDNDRVLLHLDLHLDRDSLASLQIFMRRNESTVRFLGPDGEHVAVDVQAAHAFLKTLLRCTDRPTGLLCLEAEAPFGALSLWERGALIAEDHFEQHVLEREGQYPLEDQPREPAETCFHDRCYEVWSECGSDFFGRTTDLVKAKRKAAAIRKTGIPAVVCLTERSVVAG